LDARLVGRVSPRRATHFLLLRQEKVSKEKASRIRRPARSAGTLRCSGQAGGAETRPAGSDICASFSACPCATRLLITAEKARYPTPQVRAMARTCLQFGCSKSVAVLAGLSSAAAGGSGRALFERSELGYWGQTPISLLAKPLLYAPAMRAFGGKKNRDCLSEASSSGSPSKARSAGCPKGRRQRGRLSFAYFCVRVTLLRKVSDPRAQRVFGEQRKPAKQVSVKVSSRRATPGQQAQQNSTKNSNKQCPSPAGATTDPRPGRTN